MLEYGRALDIILYDLSRLQLPVIGFDQDQAVIAASLRPVTKPFGLSLGDRACIALGMQRQCRILTADKTWKTCKLDAKIEVIR
jgi:PIN domain nuclease of toxin-antitoxin system